jgi:hypothetical protein
MEKNIFHEYGRKDAPLVAYATISLFFLLLLGILLFLTSQKNSTENFNAWDIILLSLATFKISWLISKDAVTSFLRAWFTKFEGWAGPGASVSEIGRGAGLQLAVGELLHCQWCVALWVAVILVFSLLFFPVQTKIVLIIFAILSFSDFLTSIYIWSNKRME